MQNWMEKSFDEIKSTRLIDLVIPGTHNSNTSTF